MAKARKMARKSGKKKVHARRKPAGSKASTRRAVKAKTRAKARKPQRFTVSHHREEDFDQGLRTYSAYRDLGLAPATDGLVQAHVIRMTKPFAAAEVAIPHYHDVDFQMVYVLKGWFQSEFEGEGVHTFHAGSCWIQPPRDQAHRAWLFRRLRAAGNRVAGRFRNGDAGLAVGWAKAR